jgi:hypothetical protein
VAVAGLIRAVTGSRQLEGPGWRLAVERPVARSERLGPFGAGDGWTAVLGVRRGLKLLVTGDGEVPDPLIEAWAGEPGESSDGLAALPLPSDSGRPSKIVYYGARVQDGVLVPVRRVLRDRPRPQRQPGRGAEDGQRS